MRQQSAFSSFSIPSKWAKHDEWDQREGPQARSETARMMLRVEREELETRAGRYGCSLIIKPSIRAELHGDNGTRTRLELLATFLESMKELDNQVRVGIWPPDEPAFRNLTIVGDWFLADAVVPFGGGSYTKTLFTWHGPTVHRLIREFDELLDDLIGEMDTGGLSTREYAIQVIGQELDSLG